MEIPQAPVKSARHCSRLPRKSRVCANDFGSPMSRASRSASSASGIASMICPEATERMAARWMRHTATRVRSSRDEPGRGLGDSSAWRAPRGARCCRHHSAHKDIDLPPPISLLSDECQCPLVGGYRRLILPKQLKDSGIFGVQARNYAGSAGAAICSVACTAACSGLWPPHWQRHLRHDHRRACCIPSLWPTVPLA